MTTRCKLRLSAITSYPDGPAKTLKFSAVYDQSIPEDQRFQKATPSANFEMYVDNPAVLDAMKLGDSFYVDFVPVPKP